MSTHFTRVSVFTAAAVVALVQTSPVWAEDFLISAPVTDVTVYPRGATVIRKFSVDLPEGQHRILIPYDANGRDNGPPRLDIPGGIALGALQVLPGYLTDANLILTSEQHAAQDRVEAARDAVRTHDHAVARGQAVVQGQEQKIAYLRTLSGASQTITDPDALHGASDMVAEQISQAFVAKLEAQAALRGITEARDDAAKALAQAERDLSGLALPVGDVDMLAISVEASAAGPVELTLDTLISNAGWEADYDLNLKRGDPAQITMSRKVVLGQWTSEAWSNVALTLSTANPFAQVVPTAPYPSLAQIAPKGKAGYGRSSLQAESDATEGLERASAPSPVLEELVIVAASAVIEGLSVTYDYPRAISVAPNGKVILSLDDFVFDAREFNRAAPRFDQTAFLMGEFTNNTTEPFLPGQASVSRDGIFLGRIPFELIPAGAQAEVSFGALEGLRLEYALLDNNTGDRGFLSTSSTRNQEMEFSVENLLNTTETVQTIFALPFAEQEDLSVKVRTTPAPTETDFENKRGVSVWSLELGPGEKKTVRVTVDMDWPDGEALFWQP